MNLVLGQESLVFLEVGDDGKLKIQVRNDGKVIKECFDVKGDFNGKSGVGRVEISMKQFVLFVVKVLIC